MFSLFNVIINEPGTDSKFVEENGLCFLSPRTYINLRSDAKTKKKSKEEEEELTFGLLFISHHPSLLTVSFQKILDLLRLQAVYKTDQPKKKLKKKRNKIFNY